MGLLCHCQGLGTTKTSMSPGGWDPLQGLLEQAKGTLLSSPQYGHSECHTAEKEIPGTAGSGLAAGSMKKRLAEHRAGCLPPKPAPRCGVEGAPLQQRSLLFTPRAACSR